MDTSLIALHWVIVVMAMSQAAWMVFDGSWALLYGDYVISASETPGGKPAPWARVLMWTGIEPQSRLVMSGFVIYGLGWLVVMTAFAGGTDWAWTAMLWLALGSLWYVNVGAITSSLIALSLISLELLRNAG